MAEREPRAPRTSSRAYRTLLEFPVVLIVSFVLVFGFVRPVIAAPFYVGSESMIPTLQVWDRLLINKLAYDFTGPNRGDIVLFESPAAAKDPLIKRVVGLPGETIELRSGTLYVNDEPHEEPYLIERHSNGRSYGPQKIPEGHFFVMGDNRSNSFDSRFFGPVPEEHLIGESLVRFWPPTRAGVP